MKLDMSRGAFRAAVFLFILALALAAGNLLFTAHEINSTRAAEASAVILAAIAIAWAAAIIALLAGGVR